MSDFDSVATRALGLKLRGKSLCQNRLFIPGNGDVFLTSLPCQRHCSDMLGLILRGENLHLGLVVGFGGGGDLVVSVVP